MLRRRLTTQGTYFFERASKQLSFSRNTTVRLSTEEGDCCSHDSQYFHCLQGWYKYFYTPA
jgi:hypothetical protein